MIKKILLFQRRNELILDLGRLILIFFPAALYLPMIITNILSILLGFVITWTLVSGKARLHLKNPVILLFLMMYLLIFTGFFHEIDDRFIWVDLEKKLSLVVLPVAIAVVPMTQKDYKALFEVFFWSGVIASSGVLLLSTWQFFVLGDLEVFSNHNLSGKIGLHATYMGMYLLFSLSHVFLTLRCSMTRDLGWGILFGAFLICLTIVLLGVRIIWLSLFLTVMVLTAKQFLVFRSNSTKVFFVIVSIIMLTGLFFFEPVKVRLLESINYKGEYTTDKVWGGRGIRFMIWASAVELIREKPIIGYGSSSSALEALERRYKEKKEGPLLHMMKGGKRFNAHNQYLEEFLKHGLFLGSFYVIALFLLLVQGIKNKDMTIIFLMFIVLSVSLTETVFELNKGIVFVSFFVPIVLRKSRGTPRIEANA